MPKRMHKRHRHILVAKINSTYNKGDCRGRLCLEVGSGPLFILFGELSLHPWDGNGGPYASPEEGEDPSDLADVRVERMI
jgi:hypothetical protein